jgi:hypothetical protein
MTIPFKARVTGGRLRLDEPVDLPDGTVIDLVPADQGDDLTDEERRRLHEAIAGSAAEFAEGRGIAAAEAISRLRATRRG